jgi:magnesium-transporting ATPase (P-type)
MSTILELHNDEKTEHDHPRRIHCKGASEIVLSTCSHYLNADGVK